MNIRKAQMRDIDEIMNIYASAREFMRASGNPNQWGDGYPSRELIEADIESGLSYIVEDEGEIIACFFFKVGEDPTYVRIYEGEWIGGGEYGVIHRIAVKYNGRGIIARVFEFCSGISRSIRIDTHRDNIPMQRALEKNGFTRCGIIYLPSSDERIAYQRIL